MSDREGNSFLWFLTGLGIGAAIGVLYAPHSGQETRNAIMRRAEDGREVLKERAARAREQAGEYVERGREVLNQ